MIYNPSNPGKLNSNEAGGEEDDDFESDALLLGSHEPIHNSRCGNFNAADSAAADSLSLTVSFSLVLPVWLYV